MPLHLFASSHRPLRSSMRQLRSKYPSNRDVQYGFTRLLKLATGQKKALELLRSPCLCHPGTFYHKAEKRCAVCDSCKQSFSWGALSCSTNPPGEYLTDTGVFAICPLRQNPNLCAEKDCPQLCPAGLWSEKQGRKPCKDCPAGTASANPGANNVTSCEPCQPGFWSPPGSIKCTACPAGSISESSGAQRCSKCP